jgi:predicted transcriptional regulator
LDILGAQDMPSIAENVALTPVSVLEDEHRVGVLLSPLRRSMLGLLAAEPSSATVLARRLGLARQKVNYHLRQLERAGFVELSAEVRRRGCIERSFRATASAYVISPALLGVLAVDPDKIQDRFSSSYLIAVAARLLSDVGALRRRAAEAEQRLATLTLQTEVRFASPETRTAFANELTAAVAELVTRYDSDSPGSRPFRFVIGGHPVPRTDGADRAVDVAPEVPT